MDGRELHELKLWDRYELFNYLIKSKLFKFFFFAACVL
jgi:hypothetical protein